MDPKMDLLSLFNGGKDGKRFEKIRMTSRASGHSSLNTSMVSAASLLPQTVLCSGTDYVEEYVQKENEELLQTLREMHLEKSVKNMDEVSVGTVPIQADVENNTKFTEIYKEFNFSHRPNSCLPIIESKKDIVDHVKTHSVTVIQGATGCGKSTQVPQFILDHCCESKTPCNIIVTQPRRIAALSIATRVSDERAWQLGTVVGVQMGMYKKMSEKTLLTYCTTGVLLRKFVSAKNMNDYTHVVVDEVHERDQEMDFLLLVIRKLLRTNSRQVRIILMSATFNVEKFSQYFSVPTADGFIPAPIISIPKKRNYKVAIHYLEEMHALDMIPEVSSSEPRVDRKMREFCRKLITVLDCMDKGEIDPDDLDPEDLRDGGYLRPAVLVFLPGIYEIEEMHALLAAQKDILKWDIVPLHSSITNEEQARVFECPPAGYRRVILSTNIAESSITIENVKYVIDLCLTKQLCIDPATNFQCLELCWASKANCEQRSGRAGRVMNGRVYRMITKEFYENLPSEGAPEIRRCPLETLVLNTKILDLGEPRAILALAIDPPDISNLERTILLLKEAGGLISMPHNSYDGQLTDLGRIMAALPLEIHVSKLIALGNVFNVLEEAIMIAAGMSVKSVFSNPMRDKMSAYQKKIVWADGSMSDQMAFINAYKTWQRQLRQNRFRKRSSGERNWCQKNFLQVRALHEVDHLILELTHRLESLGIQETRGLNKVVLENVDKAFYLRVCIAGAFYPNYFVRVVNPDAHDVTFGTRELGGLDPRRTVFLQGWRPEQPGRLYAKRIQNLFQDVVPSADRAIVEFDASARVYVTFDDDDSGYSHEERLNIPGKVCVSVYKALKLGKLRALQPIPVLDVKNSMKRAEEVGVHTTSTTFFNKENFRMLTDQATATLPKLPPLKLADENEDPNMLRPLEIIEFQNPHRFWARFLDPETKRQLEFVENFLKNPESKYLKKFVEGQRPGIGCLVLAPRGEDHQIVRAIVESLSQTKTELNVEVRCIDWGDRTVVGVSQLLEFTRHHGVTEIPGLAFQATMTAVEPSKKLVHNQAWSVDACEFVRNFLVKSKDSDIRGQVYSVVNSVVSLIIWANDPQKKKNFELNQLLIDRGFADRALESYNSINNHKVRLQAPTLTDPQHLQFLELLQHDRRYFSVKYPNPPAENECRNKINLKGPMSPLEISLMSLASVASSKKVRVEPNSVNSILMDTNPDDPHERLLVAGTVSQNTSGTSLTLRNTTYMPNVPGLTALMCLIFAPKIELRRSTNGSHYIGALCGLGYDKRNRITMLYEHDMEVRFDTEFNLDDMQQINMLRHFMSMGICVRRDIDDDVDIISIQNKAISQLRKLTEAGRRSKVVPRENLLHFNRWMLYDPALFMDPTVNDQFMMEYIYPLHDALRLEDRNELVEELQNHVKELREMAQSDPKLSETINVICRLCNVQIISRQALRLHLYMKDHRDRENSQGLRRTFQTY